MKTSFWLTHVLLEQSYIIENDRVTGTKTKSCNVRVEEGKIAEIIDAEVPLDTDLMTYDGSHLLMLPSFVDGHIHLDKTYYGDAWQAVKPISSIFDRIEEEKVLLPRILPQSQQQAEGIMTLIQGLGTTHVRTHCNIEHVSGLHRLEATKRALATFANQMSSEIVAFPQHGLLHSDSAGLVRQAMREGATHVGGLDPRSVDGDIEKSLQTMFEIAIEADAGIDMHLHEGGEHAKHTLLRLADLTEEAGLIGRVTVSHAFWFAGADASEAELMADRFSELGISIASTVPIGRTHMPLPMLDSKGVRVSLGTDSLTDHWSPFGNGDMLEKAGRFAELYHYNDERRLSQSLRYITGGITPLDTNGNQSWPKVGDDANFVLVQASCSAEAVARRSPRQSVWYRGNKVSEMSR